MTHNKIKPKHCGRSVSHALERSLLSGLAYGLEGRRTWASAGIFPGGQHQHFAHLFQIADDAMQTDVNKTLYSFLRPKNNAPCSWVSEGGTEGPRLPLDFEIWHFPIIILAKKLIFWFRVCKMELHHFWPHLEKSFWLPLEKSTTGLPLQIPSDAQVAATGNNALR